MRDMDEPGREQKHWWLKITDPDYLQPLLFAKYIRRQGPKCSSTGFQGFELL